MSNVSNFASKAIITMNALNEELLVEELTDWDSNYIRVLREYCEDFLELTDGKDDWKAPESKL